MTREEAKEILKAYRNKLSNSVSNQLDEDIKAFDMAIEVLKQEPCEDCISRRAVDELSKALVHTTRDKADFLCNFWEGLRKLPPVTPEKTSEWIPILNKRGTEIAVKCKRCGGFAWKGHRTNCCPNCGVKMESEEEK